MNRCFDKFGTTSHPHSCMLVPCNSGGNGRPQSSAIATSNAQGSEGYFGMDMMAVMESWKKST